MDRFRTRASVIVCALSAVLTLAACSAGQVSQVAQQESAVNGTKGGVGGIALRDVRIQAEQTTDRLTPGTTVDLLLVVANDSVDTDDTLLGISSDVGAVALAGDTAVAASSRLTIAPAGEAAELDAAGGQPTAEATVLLAKPISNGLTYDFTFNFAKAGQTTLSVPIDAGVDQPRMESDS